MGASIIFGEFERKIKMPRPWRKPFIYAHRNLAWAVYTPLLLCCLLACTDRKSAKESHVPWNSSSAADELTILLPGDIPLTMARIPAGSFVMGSPEDEQGRFEDESPQTNVTLSRDFYMGKYPVTQAQWLAVMEIWPEVEPSSMYGVGPDYPAHDISWHDTQDFLITLNAHIMRTNQGPATLRLPTEAEWEYAARAGTTTRFSFGDSLINVEGDSNGDRCEDDGIRSQHMWYCGNNAPLFESGYGIKPVGKKLPNAFGLYDMHGNVSEWCLDWWAESLPGGSVTDPTGPASGSCRVIRGGSWLTHASVCRSARRLFDEPTSRDPRQGFRVAAYR